MSDRSWDVTLRRLQDDFLAGASARLKEMRAALARLREDKGAAEPVKMLQRAFHGFAGSGATYGFPELSRLGREAAEHLSLVLHERGQPQGADLDAWQARILDLQKAVAASAPSLVAGLSEPLTPEPRAADLLVVDDDTVMLRAMTAVLTQEGFAVRSASTHAEALTALAAQVPDGMIVDILLPDGSGYELIRHLRSRPGGERPAALMLSMLGGFFDKVEAIHCGADGYFEKPPDWEALKRRLQHLLERPSSARLLCVEDEPAQAAFVQAVLSQAGYTVRICADAARFEGELIEFQPDLVLMDALLPGGITGFDLVRLLRQDERYTTLPVVFVTADSSLASQIQSLQAGGDSHLVKPVPPALLLAAVGSAIERSRLLRGLLTRDGLTRLLTHSAFLERAQLTLGQARRDGGRTAAAWVMLDLDSFKSVNDRHGHPVGDRVLATLSALLRRRLRQTDAIGRYGGEEFAILLHDLSADEAFRLVDRLRDEFAVLQHTGRDGQPFNVTFSAGISMLDIQKMDLDLWRALADSALYDAKRSGRNRVAGVRS